MRRFILPITASLAVVLGAPFIGQLRAALQDAFPGQYTRIIAAAVFGSVAVALIVALVRIRRRRALRYGAVAAALVIGSSYAFLSRTGDPSVDAVERFHFVEYGLITFLFYRAWRPVGDASLLALPVMAALIVGICEEWLQWFVPSRVGELRDVVLNLWAIICGLLFSVAIDPPERLAPSLRHESWTRIKRFGALTLLAFGLFLTSVHLGYEIDDPKTGSFRSTYSRDELTALARERTATWRANPPLTWSRLSREDQYLTEGVTHVRRRNTCWSEEKFRCAWHENLILEEYFAPVLDTPTYISATGLRWAPEQRADAERRLGGDDAAYLSEADEVPIFTWPKPSFWLVLSIPMVLLLWPDTALRRARDTA